MEKERICSSCAGQLQKESSSYQMSENRQVAYNSTNRVMVFETTYGWKAAFHWLADSRSDWHYPSCKLKGNATLKGIVL